MVPTSVINAKTTSQALYLNARLCLHFAKLPENKVIYTHRNYQQFSFPYYISEQKLYMVILMNFISHDPPKWTPIPCCLAIEIMPDKITFFWTKAPTEDLTTQCKDIPSHSPITCYVYTKSRHHCLQQKRFHEHKISTSLKCNIFSESLAISIAGFLPNSLNLPNPSQYFFTLIWLPSVYVSFMV